MVNIILANSFKRKFEKIKDSLVKEKVKKQIIKVADNPEIGKPMKYGRKGTRELYIAPFRLSYYYSMTEDKIEFLDLYHKDEQ